MKLIRFFALTITLFCASNTSAQMAGNYNIPSNIPTIAAAIASLNTLGVSGPVTINVTAGYTETAINGGYKLYNVLGSSSTNQISFVKSGIGANPLISAYSTGTATPNDAVQDGVWWLIGADYITIDGIDIIDPNTSGNAMMEFGYGLFKNSPTDGCQNNTIKNCVITLQNLNVGSNNFSLPGGSTGIMVLYLCATTTTNYVPTSFSGSNSNNKIYSNLIQSCHSGIVFLGYSDPGPHTNADYGNDIGGLTSVTGNTVINFGGGTGCATYGIKTTSQYSLNVSGNVLNNNNGSGLDPATQLDAIKVDYAPDANVAVKNNTLTLRRTGSIMFMMNGVYVDCCTNGTTNNITIQGNVIPSYGYTTTAVTTTCGFLIYNGTGALNAYVDQNSISNISINVTSSPQNYFYFIYTGNTTNSCSINSNSVTSLVGQGNSILSFISSSGAANATENNNYVNNIVWQGTSPAAFYCINSSTNGNKTISNNKVTNISTCNSGGIYGMYIGTGASTVIAANNEIGNIGNTPGTGGGVNFVGIQCNSSAGMLSVVNNTVHSAICSNTNITQVNTVTGIDVNGNNELGYISKNRIYDLSNNASGNVTGIDLLGTNTYTISNNLIAALQATNTNHTAGIIGINFSIGDCKFFHNTILLNGAASTGTLFGSICFSVSNSGSALWQLKNNIFVNTSVATGTGITSVIRQYNTNFGGYSSVSNNNIFYAGPPSANHVIYCGSTNQMTLPFFKATVFPRESNSKTELPPFISIVGTAPNYLNIDPNIPTQVESGGAAISSVPDDYAGNIRNSTTPDIGAWEGNYSPADLFPPTISAITYGNSNCSLTNRVLIATIADPTGVASGSLLPKMYYKVNSNAYASVQGTLSAGTPSNGVWAFALNYSASVGDNIFYFLAAQDASTLNNFTLTPSAGASANDVNTIITPPTSPNFYTVSVTPSVTVNSGSICAGQNFVIIPSGANQYTISGGSYTVSPSATTNYTVIGDNTSGCISNPVIAQVTVNTNPLISVNNGSLCYGSTYTITPSGANTYTFSGGSAIVSPTSSISYSITGTSSAGCLSTNTAVAFITVLTTPTVSAFGPTTTVCANTTQTLSATGAVSYSWSLGGTNSTTTISPSSTQVYTITGSAANGCQDTAQITLSVYPVSILSILGNTPICTGETSTLTGSGAASYTWNPGNSQLPAISVSPTITTSYTLAGTDTLGCTFTTSASVIVNACVGLIEIKKDLLMAIFPNPSEGTFTIETSEYGKGYSVAIYNYLGQNIITKPLELDLSVITFPTDIAKGVYFIGIYKNNQLQKRQQVIVR